MGANTNYKYNSQLINARAFYLYIPNSGIYNEYYTVQYDSIYVSPKLTYLGAATKPYHEHILNIHSYNPAHISIVNRSFFFVLEGDPVKTYHYVSPKLICLGATNNTYKYKYIITYPYIYIVSRYISSLGVFELNGPYTYSYCYVSFNVLIPVYFSNNGFGSLQSIIY